MAVVIFPRSGGENQSLRCLKKDHWSTKGLIRVISGFPEHLGARQTEGTRDQLLNSTPSFNHVPGALKGTNATAPDFSLTEKNFGSLHHVYDE